MMEFYLRGTLGTGRWGISSVENALFSTQIKCDEHLQYPLRSFIYKGILHTLLGKMYLWELA